MGSAAEKLLAYLFFNISVHDSQITGTTGRDELVSLGYAEHVDGFTFLSKRGVEAAHELDCVL